MGMKIQTYSIGSPVDRICKSYAIWIREGSTIAPLVYLKRPKWITSDSDWQKILQSIRLDLPKDTEIFDE